MRKLILILTLAAFACSTVMVTDAKASPSQTGLIQVKAKKKHHKKHKKHHKKKTNNHSIIPK